MNVRDCELAEAELAIALWEDCGLTRPWNDTRVDFRQALESPASTVLGGFHDGLLIASVMVGFDGHRGWVYYLAVDPAHRRRGLGTQMMTGAETWLRQLGARKLQFMVRGENASSLRFYETLGFEQQAVITLGRFLA